ncbi:MAG: hypothetical protein WA949_18055 [Phormidesmis sp.]
MPLTQQSPTDSFSGGRAKGSQPASDSDKVCWIEVQRYPYHPDHQVELLHLQAEADALIIKLQASERRNAQCNSQ